MEMLFGLETRGAIVLACSVGMKIWISTKVLHTVDPIVSDVDI
jgi:hypothetical protein